MPTPLPADAGQAPADDPPTTIWHARPGEDVARELATGADGLSRDEARRRLDAHGANALEDTPPTSRLVLLLHQFTSPLIYILLVAAVVTLLLHEFIDAAVIAVVLVLNAIIGFTQERKAESAVRALMRLMSPHARVVRDGREWDIESRELVPGDLVLLESGARVPADLRLASATHLRVDESLFTGESVPVTKTEGPPDAPDAPIADRHTMTFTGTTVISGRARGYVVATGARTELGAIAEHVRAESETVTPLQQRMAGFARTIGAIVGVASLTAFALGVWLGGSVADMFLVAVALAVSAVPEGLPIAFTVTLAIGVNRMAKRQAIVRRLPAVETLGSTTVIGSDKTGTLTENRMTVREVWAAGHTHHLGDDAATAGAAPDTLPTDPIARVLLCGVLTNEAHLYDEGDAAGAQGDPTEAALLVAARHEGWSANDVRARWPVLEDLPFEPERQYSASLRAIGDERWLFVKGAPERVLAMTAHVAGADGLGADDVHEAASDMGRRGMRVLGMACRRPEADERLDLAAPDGLTFLGLQGLIDPPREGVRDAIARCQDAGIRVVMITGDHARTAEAIGAQLGLDVSGGVMTGPELAAADDATLASRLEEVTIYARMAPEQKLRVVRTLQDTGHVVAVTGDGVNDAPALKAADIGVAMGRSGTDVAREASDMVLADDNFISIVAAVEEGRITFSNLRKVVYLLVSTGAAEVLMILVALALGWPLPLVAAQILWLNLVTNGLQDVALAFEPGEPDVLTHPPRAREEGVMSRLMWERTVVAGAVMTAGTLLLFQWELAHGASLTRAQTIALTTMVLFQIFHVGNCRSDVQSVFRRSLVSNPFLLAASSAALALHAGALYWGPTQFVLRVEPLDVETWIRMTAVALSITLVMEVDKLARRPRAPRGSQPARTQAGRRASRAR